MIRTTIFLLTLLISADNFAQCNSYVLDAVQRLEFPTNPMTININDKPVFVFSDTDWTYVSKLSVPDTSLLDGTWVLLADNNIDKILLQVTYKNHLPDGKLICRDNDGTLTEEWNYNNGKLDGKQIQYYNKKLWAEENYIYGDKDGLQKRYFENGQISNLENHKNGKRDGEQKSYYMDGSMQSISTYRNGQIIGDYKSWYKNGKNWRVEHYDDNGRKQGAFYVWDEKGRIIEYSFFKDNLPMGISLGFGDGKPTFERYFESGQLKREVFEYYTSPQKYFETKKKKKVEYDFTQVEHSIKKEALYEDNIIIIRTYYPSGQLQSEEPIFFAGEKDCKKIYKKTGIHKFWTEDGKLEKELVYKDDKLIETKK